MSAGVPVESPGHFLTVEPEECRRLLRDATIGRVSWPSSAGLVTLPVTYGVHDDGRIGFHAAARGLLSELAAEPADVAFEVDDIDEETGTGWSVLVRGRARAHEGRPTELPQPWAPGERPVLVAIEPTAVTGRSVSAAWKPRG